MHEITFSTDDKPKLLSQVICFLTYSDTPVYDDYLIIICLHKLVPYFWLFIDDCVYWFVSSFTI